MAHIPFARALSAHLARRIVRIATIVVVVVVASLLLIIGALAYFLSSWWWLLLIPLVIVAVALFVIHLVLSFIIRKLYPQQLSAEQSAQLDSFVDKVEGLLEARSTPFPIIVLICIKDLLVHRDLTTVRSIIKDSGSLMSDYRSLEKLF